MLVLTRKLDESLQIGDDIKITVLRIKGNTIRIGIEAPRDVRVVRSELNLTQPAQDTESHASPTAASQPAAPTRNGMSSESATVTTIVDSPNAAAPRLFVGKVTADGSVLSLEESNDGKAASSGDAANVISFDGHAGNMGSAPLRAFLQASRGLTAV